MANCCITPDSDTAERQRKHSRHDSFTVSRLFILLMKVMCAGLKGKFLSGCHEAICKTPPKVTQIPSQQDDTMAETK